MVVCLEKSEGNADVHEIVDFLTASSVHYALTVIDDKTLLISESPMRSDLHFNDEDGITCLINDAIFENLALMGYESDSDKLTFQKALFSPQWKYLIHTILHCLSSKSTSWNEFSTNIASAVICLANGQKFNFSKLIFDGMLRNLDTNTKKFLMYPRFLQLFLNNQISLVEPFNDIYKTPVHTKKVFTNMKRKGKDFSGRITPLFASMLAPPVVEGEGSGQPTEPQPAPSTTQPIIEEQIPVTESSSPQNTQTPRQALQEDTQLPQTSVPIPNVADEAVFKEWDDRVVRATTTAASLDTTQASGNISKTQSMVMSNNPLSQEIGSADRPMCQEAMRGVSAQTRSERASIHSYDSPLLGVNTLGSDEERIEYQELTDNIPPIPYDSPLSGGYTPGRDEGRPDLHELMAICTKLSDRVLDLEKEKDTQAVEILKLKNRIKKLERKAKSSIPPPKRRLYKQVDSSDDSLGEENASKQGRNDSNKTEEFNLSDKGSGGTEVFDDTTAAEKDVNAAEPVSTAGDAVTAASVIPDIDTAGPSNVSAAGPSTSTAGDIFEDEMMTIADTLVAIRSTRPRTTSVVIRDVEEEPRRATPIPIVQSQDKGKGKMVEPEPTPKNPIKAQIQRDAEIAQRLFEEEQLKFEREKRIARERAAEQEAKDAALIKQIKYIQARMDANELLAEILQQEEREQFTI
ncbi:hypothetical protein Tco_0578387 [Tanacetum coccineum]